eukprot:TRINITY_DN15_c1_g1_i1.p1 TRINITY_DN15_c1_g1~~TRINITY_DN15_c1_g1_i1.p1  ORF type:complete len:857 (-),score=184.62 TRINITY_DN15_c1_g1_i1:189-2690(-)
MEQDQVFGAEALLSLGSILRREVAGYTTPASSDAGKPFGAMLPPGYDGMPAPSAAFQEMPMAQPDAAAGGMLQMPHVQMPGPMPSQFQASTSNVLGIDERILADDFKGNTLHLHLTELQSADQRCVFVCRGITKMGFHSQALLKAHFSRYGEVCSVLVTHSKVKPFRNGYNSRIRPGSIAFVVMADPQCVVKILNEDPFPNIAGCQVRVEKFHQNKNTGKGGASTSSQSDSLDFTDTQSYSSEPSSNSFAGSGSGVQGVQPYAMPPSFQHAEALPSIAPEQAPAWAPWTMPAHRPLPTEPPAPELGLQPPNQNACVEKLVEIILALEGQKKVHPQMTEQQKAIAMLQELHRGPGRSLLSSVTSQHLHEWIQEQQKQLSHAHQLQQLQQMQRQMAELKPQLDNMKQLINRLTSAAVLAHAQEMPPSAPASVQPDASALLAALQGNLTWPGQSLPDPALYQAQLAAAANWQAPMMPSAPGSASASSIPGPFDAAATGAASSERLLALAKALAAEHMVPQADQDASTAVNADSSNNHAFHSGLSRSSHASHAGQSKSSHTHASHAGKSKSSHPSVRGWQKEVFEEASSAKGKNYMPSSNDCDLKTTLGMHLTELQDEDPQCVFIVRRISSMGFQSQDKLTSHYGQFGKVLKVLVAHSKVKPFRRHSAQARIRPGSLGFIVMKDQQSVEKILALGAEQTVAGCCICVEPFEQIAKPPGRTTATSNAGDSTTTGDSTTPGSGSRSGSNGSDGSGSRDSNGSNGSEEGSDKGNSAGESSQPQAEGSQGGSQEAGSQEAGSDSNGGDSQSESSNHAASPGQRSAVAGKKDNKSVASVAKK